MRTTILAGGIRLAEIGDLVIQLVLRRLDYRSDSAWSKKKSLARDWNWAFEARRAMMGAELNLEKLKIGCK